MTLTLCIWWISTDKPHKHPLIRRDLLGVNRRGVPDADRRAKLLIWLTEEGSLLDAYSHSVIIDAAWLPSSIRLLMNSHRLSQGWQIAPHPARRRVS
jgi:hypothetical protein